MPRSTASRRLQQRSSVLLPAPEAATTIVTRPRGTVQETSRSTGSARRARARPRAAPAPRPRCAPFAAIAATLARPTARDREAGRHMPPGMDAVRLLRVPLAGDWPVATVVRALADEPLPFALTGRWAGGGAIVGAAPVRDRGARRGPVRTARRAARLHPDAPPRIGRAVGGDPREAPGGAAPTAAVGGGWFGWLGFQLGARVEQLPPPPPRPVPLPPFQLAYYDHLLRRDAAGSLVVRGARDRPPANPVLDRPPRRPAPARRRGGPRRNCRGSRRSRRGAGPTLPHRRRRPGRASRGGRRLPRADRGGRAVPGQRLPPLRGGLARA